MPAFRSQLEVKVAAELDHQSVRWEYERPVQLADGRSPRYLPDFTITAAPSELKLPHWLECKPQEFLYALRDVLGVTRKHGDRFQGEVVLPGVTAQDLRELLIEELWKPKRLAELTGEPVLVLGTVGAISSLSVEMRPDGILFSRSQPFVNWLGIQKAKERELKRLQWETEAAERQQRWEQEIERRRVLFDRNRSIDLFEALRGRHCGPTKWAKLCCGCSDWVRPGSGSLRKVVADDGGTEWRVVCFSCLHRSRS